MNVDDQFEPPIEIGTSDGLTEPHRFATPKEIVAWFDQQINAYNQLVGKYAASDPPLQQGWTGLQSWLTSGKNRIAKLATNPATTKEQYDQTLRRQLEFYKKRQLFDLNSPIVHFLQSLAPHTPELAARVAVILSGAALSLQNSDRAGQWLEAGAIATAWRHGWIDKTPAEEASLNALRQKWSETFRDIESELTATGRSIEQELKEVAEQKLRIESVLSKFQDDASKEQEKLKEDVDAAIKGGISQIGDFTNAYNQALALRAPTQYWRDKQRGHRLVATLWFVAFVISAAVGVSGVWYVWHITVEPRSSQEVLSYTAFIPSIGAALLVVWFMRMFSRQVISNLSLSADAGERVAMVKTFLALTEGGHAQPSDRGLILSALFRPAARTVDDAAPPTLVDLASKIASKP